MTDSNDPTSGADTSAGPDRGTTGAPRWVRALAVIAAVVLLLVLILLLTGGPGRHGPGRHARSGGLGQMPASRVAQHGA